MLKQYPKYLSYQAHNKCKNLVQDNQCPDIFVPGDTKNFLQELLPWSKVMSMQKVKVKGQGHRGQHPT